MSAEAPVRSVCIPASCVSEREKGKKQKKEQAAVKAAILISPSERANIGNESRLKGKRAHVTIIQSFFLLSLSLSLSLSLWDYYLDTLFSFF